MSRGNLVVSEGNIYFVRFFPRGLGLILIIPSGLLQSTVSRKDPNLHALEENYLLQLQAVLHRMNFESPQRLAAAHLIGQFFALKSVSGS